MSALVVDVLNQAADFELPYPPSKNELTTHSVTLKKSSSASQLSTNATNYSRSLAPWRYVASCLRVNVFPTSKGKKYFDDVASVVLKLRQAGQLQDAPFVGQLTMELVAHPSPLKRRRDSHNLIEALADALQHAGVVQNDAQLHEVSIRWGQPSGTPSVRVAIRKARNVDLFDG